MNFRLPLAATLAAVFAVTASVADAQEQLLWSRPWSNYTTIPSRTWTAPLEDVEAADDFDVQGTITRVVFEADGCFGCQVPTVSGATLRFYSWNNGTPGALQHQVDVAAPSPLLLFNPQLPTTVEMRLPTPFLATGRHFVSMQVHFQGSGHWGVWSSSVGNPTLSWTKVRNNLTGGQWTTPNVNPAIAQQLFADMTFSVFGMPAGAGPQLPIPCQTWSELPTAIPPATTFAAWRAVKAFAADDAWAVGDKLMPSSGITGSMTVTMHWDGSAWSEVPSPNPGPVGLENTLLYAVDGVASSDLWAAGLYTRSSGGGWTGPQVFAMHWDGAAWTPPPNLPMPNNSVGAGVTGSRVFDIKALASNDVWFVGFWIDVVSSASGLTTRPGLLMRWDGSGMQQTILPIVTGVGSQSFAAVDASGPNDVWVVGGAASSGSAAGTSVPVVFRFDGANWTHTPCAVPSLPGWRLDLYDVAAPAPNDVFVFGVMSTQSPTPQSQYFVSHWDGSAWTVLPGPPNGGKAAVLAGNDIWAVGTQVMHWNGASWSVAQEFLGVTGPGLGAVDAIGPCELLAVGGQTRIGQITPFAARIDHPDYWRTMERLPTVPQRAPGVLRALTPPRAGLSLQVAISDPGNALASASAMTFWLAAMTPAPGYPFPSPLPFGGAGGGLGELFLDALAIGFVSSPVSLVPGVNAAAHAVVLPASPAVVGMDLFTQGLLFGSSGAVLVSNGLDLHIGS